MARSRLKAVVAACAGAWLLCLTSASAVAASDAAALDTGYGDRGVVVRPDASAVAIAPDGGVLAAEPGFAVVRLGPDGRPVAGFGVLGGPVGLGPDHVPSALAPARDGSLFVAGANAAGELVVIRLTAAGLDDPRFQHARLASQRPRGAVGAVATADGGVLVALAEAVTRLRADGSVDPSYGEAGRALASTDLAAREISGVLDAGAGRLIVLSQRNEGDLGVVVSRLTADGRLDDGFGTAGSRVIAGVANAHATARSGGGVILVSEESRCRGRLGGCRGELVRRLDARGRTISTRVIAGSAGAIPFAIAEDRAGRVLVVSDHDAYAGSGNAVGGGMVVRLDRAGRRDRRFGRCGAGAPRTGHNVLTDAVAVQAGGRILQAGRRYVGGRFIATQGIVVTAQRGGRGAHPRRGRPTIDPRIPTKPGSVRRGVVLPYATPVDAVLRLRVSDSRGRVVADGRRRVGACSAARLRVRFARRPAGRKLLFEATARGRGRPRRYVEGACIGRRGAITMDGADRLSQVRCPRSG